LIFNKFYPFFDIIDMEEKKYMNRKYLNVDGNG